MPGRLDQARSRLVLGGAAATPFRVVVDRTDGAATFSTDGVNHHAVIRTGTLDLLEAPPEVRRRQVNVFEDLLGGLDARFQLLVTSRPTAAVSRRDPRLTDWLRTRAADHPSFARRAYLILSDAAPGIQRLAERWQTLRSRGSPPAARADTDDLVRQVDGAIDVLKTMGLAPVLVQGRELDRFLDAHLPALLTRPAYDGAWSESPRELRLEARFHRTFFLDAYPGTELAAGWFGHLVDLPAEYDLAIHGFKVPAASVMRLLNLRIRNLQATRMADAAAASVGDPLVEAGLPEAIGLRREIAANGQHAFTISAYLTLVADDLATIEQAGRVAADAAARSMARLLPATLQMAAGRVCTLPLGADPVAAQRLLPSGVVATLYPWLWDELQQPQGHLVGFRARGADPVLLDTFDESRFASANVRLTPMTESSARRAAIYCRISSDREGAGLGVARQEEDCRQLASSLGWPVATVYQDNDLSAYSGKPRPEYRAMLEAARAGEIDAIVSWHNDRLHREPRELEEFIDVCEAGRIAVQTVKAGPLDLGTPAGRMVARQFGAIARYESEHRSERIRRKHDELAKNGHLSGGGKRAYGYEAGGRTIRESEAIHIREAAHRVLAGDTIRSVCRDFNLRGIASARGGAWSAVSMKNMLISARLCGHRDYHRAGTLIPGDWPAILTLDQTLRLRALLPLKPGPRLGRPQPRGLLTSLLRCGRCGNRMTTHSPTAGARNYHCPMGKPDHPGCGIAVRKGHLDEFVVSSIFAALDTPALARAAMGPDSGSADAADFDDLAAARAKLAELGEMLAANAISTAAWRAAVGPMEARIQSTEARLADRSRSAVAAEFRGDPEELRRQWPTFSVDRQRSIIASVIHHIEILPIGKGHGGFDPDRVRIVWNG